MCGIAGILYKNRARAVAPETLLAMRDCMTHRGPDEEGIYLDGNLGLAHRRLSIIGLSTGRQPMSNAEGTICIVYNGEIYNYLDLRKQLEKKGYKFQTETDTEVIIHLYAEYGEDCVSCLNGMFAFAIWDAKTRSLFLARDRLGIKPLYYSSTNNVFVFASEIKSLLASGNVPSSCNHLAVYEYFLYRAVSGEQTLFDGVKSLLPGHRMHVTDGKIVIDRYWSHSTGKMLDLDFNESVAELKRLLEDAVGIRMMSEVPLGTFCSGGVDSSLVTAIAAGLSEQPINTFSVGFDESGYDESEFARIVSDRYKTNHHDIRLSSAKFAEYLPDLVRLNDEPLNFANSVHIYALSKHAKTHVTVVLTGEGADELFLGYPRYQVPRLAGYIRRLRLLVSPLIGMGNLLFKDARLQKLRRYLEMSQFDGLLLNSAVTGREALETVLSPDIPHSLEYRKSVLEESMVLEDSLAQLSLQDQKTYLVSILNRQDKMSMGASIESRVPFLDYRIAEFANSIKSSSKITGFEAKKIVKKVSESYLPSEIIYRRKSGFGVPLSEWFRKDDGLSRLAVSVINDAEYSEYMDKNSMIKLLSEHKKGHADHSELLWTAVNFLVWKEQYAL
ncbi:asparagine synthase (glutamine-hydrolyzing) [Crocinitomicaceae bacterium]|nr:asparagine synthase (glutamine-hydrolyzing) [Crocinitomicaceae bacterium]